jgi:putative membrane protein (TIGR04086 family)
MHWDAILRGLLTALMMQLLGALLLTTLSGQDWIAANIQLTSRFLAALASVAGGAAAARRAGSRGIAHGAITGLLFAMLISAAASAGDESLGFARMLLHWLVASAAGGVAGAVAMNI